MRPGEVQVCYDGAEILLLQSHQRLAASGYPFSVIPTRAQAPADLLAYAAVVFHDQDLDGYRVCPAHRAPRSFYLYLTIRIRRASQCATTCIHVNRAEIDGGGVSSGPETSHHLGSAAIRRGTCRARRAA
jgi:hypothetical protein